MYFYLALFPRYIQQSAENHEALKPLLYLTPVAHGEIKLKYNKTADGRGFVSADRLKFCFISVSGMCVRVK